MAVRVVEGAVVLISRCVPLLLLDQASDLLVSNLSCPCVQT